MKSIQILVLGILVFLGLAKANAQNEDLINHLLEKLNQKIELQNTKIEALIIEVDKLKSHPNNSEKKIWPLCWTGEEIDFTQASWNGLSHLEKKTRVKAYQKWYAEKLGVHVSMEITLREGVSLKMVLIPPGHYIMGKGDDDPKSKSDEKKHIVWIRKAFWLGKNEITKDEWHAVMGGKANGEANYPIAANYTQAKIFCQKVSRNPQLKKKLLRLPSESEWEYACRAGTNTPYYWGKEMNLDYCWHGKSGVDSVGRRQANSFGLHDMSGNLWEWCQDYYEINYEKTPKNEDSHTKGSEKVLRGGSYKSEKDTCRSAEREKKGGGIDNIMEIGIGFRVAMDAS